jgi:membrane protein implicated in regulation of membrane protease activity
VTHITHERYLLPDSPRDETSDAADHDTTPPANRGLLAVAGVLLLLPIVALMWVGSYAKIEPKLGAFPFFIWYQFLWVFLCSACAYASYRLVVKARPHRPMANGVSHEGEAGR